MRVNVNVAKQLLVVLVSSFLAATAWCASGTWLANGVTWKFDYAGTEATITGATGYSQRLVIPQKVYVGSTPYDVTKIDDYAFEAGVDPNISSVAAIAIPPSVRTIGNYAFSGCESLVNLELAYDALSGDGVEVIKDGAFQNAAKLEGVTFPQTVTFIGDYAFSDCEVLETVTFKGNTVAITMDPAAVFAATPFLVHANDNDNFADAFELSGSRGRTSACNIIATAELGEPFGDQSLWWAWTAPAGMTKAAFYTYGSSFGTSLGVYTGTAVDALTEVGHCDARLSDNTSFVTFDVTSGQTYYICVAPHTIGYGGTVKLGWFAAGGFSLVVHDNALLGFIGDCLTSVTVPEGVSVIETSAFDNDYDSSVDNLTDVVIPGSVTRIGDWAFYHCFNLSSVTFEDPEVSIEMELGNVFSGTPYFASMNDNDNWANAIEITGASGAVMGWNYNATIEAGEPLNGQAHTMWWKWKAPAGVKKAKFHTYGSEFDTLLGVYTGAAVDALTAVVPYNDDYWDNKSLVSFDVTPGKTYYICVAGYDSADKGIVRLGWCATGAFSLLTWGETLLEFVGECPASVTIPDSISEIVQSAFDHDNFPSVENLTSVVIPESVASIGDWAFYDCVNLQTVTFEGDALEIDMDPARVFNGTPFLAMVNANDAWVDAIELSGNKGSVEAWNAFATDELGEPSDTKYHSLWWKWTAPAGVTKAVFYTYGNEFDTTLGVYDGTAVYALADVAINDDRGVGSFVSFDVTPGKTYYICVAGYDEDEGGAVKLGWEASSGFSLVIVDDVLIGFVGDCPESVTVPNTVKEIGERAFDAYFDASAANLKNVVIPGSVTAIRYSAFSDCVNLTSVTFNEGLEVVGYEAFQGCAGLKGHTIVLPMTVVDVDEDVFWGIDGALTLMLPRSLNGTMASGARGTTDLTVGYYVKATLDPNGGVLADRVRMLDGDTYGDLSPLPTRTGYTLTGWKEGGSAVAASTVLPDVATVTLTAQWTVNTYMQTFDANGGTGGKTVTQNYGAALTAPTVTRTGYTFKGWSPEVPATVPANDATYMAQWEIVKNIVTLDFGGTITVDYGTKVSSLPVPTRDNCEFVGWFSAPTGGVLVPGDTPITAGIALYARWKPVYYLYGDVGEAVPPSASTYDGYLYEGEKIVGTIALTVGKPNKAGASSVKATVVLPVGKVTLKAAGSGKAQMVKNRPTTLPLVGGEGCEVTIGSYGMKGNYGKYGIDGARNVFVSKDGIDKSVAGAALKAWQGAVTLAWKSGEQGWNGLSAAIAAKGKVTVSGCLADGTKVSSAKAQLIVGDEWCCVPVVVTKKAKLAFLLWLPIESDESMHTGVAGLPCDDIKAGKPGYLGGEGVFHIDVAAFRTTARKDVLPYLPDGVIVRGSQKWDLPKAGKVTYVRGATTVDAAKLLENPSALKLKFKSKDGTFNGSFKTYAAEGGKLKSETVNVAGVLVDGIGYGTAAIKNVGSVPVTIK